jgi:hypothetical protein
MSPNVFPLPEGIGLYKSLQGAKELVLPPPFVGEGRGGGRASIDIPTPILTFPHQGGRN